MIQIAMFVLLAVVEPSVQEVADSIRASTLRQIGPALSLHEIDGEAGFTPDQPKPEDIKALGDGLFTGSIAKQSLAMTCRMSD